jgi:hypothetical protein
LLSISVAPQNNLAGVFPQLAFQVGAFDHPLGTGKSEAVAHAEKFVQRVM